MGAAVDARGEQHGDRRGLLHRNPPGPLETPTGETIPPTGKQVPVRECDIATVKEDLITSHRFYFDQSEFLEQLGLAPPA